MNIFEAFGDHFFNVGDVGYFAENGKIYKGKISGSSDYNFIVVDTNGLFHVVPFSKMHWRKDKVKNGIEV